MKMRIEEGSGKPKSIWVSECWSGDERRIEHIISIITSVYHTKKTKLWLDGIIASCELLWTGQHSQFLGFFKDNWHHSDKIEPNEFWRSNINKIWEGVRLHNWDFPRNLTSLPRDRKKWESIVSQLLTICYHFQTWDALPFITIITHYHIQECL